jgi:UDP-galactopyranose mutase
MLTFNKLWGVNTPKEAKQKIDETRFTGSPKNLEEQALSQVGKEIYEKLIEGYTTKQWMKSPKELPHFIIKRIPVRFTFDNNYFFDKYQGIPIGGYTPIFERLLSGIEVRLNTDYFLERDNYDNISNNVIYTGPIDKFFNYKFGCLEYRPLKFEHETIDEDNYQGWSIINYTDKEVPYTRIVEHKHFENSESKKTIVTKEYPIEWDINAEPYYPINDDINQKIFDLYYKESKTLKNIFFGGRLSEYKYYDMHQVIDSALTLVENFNKK